MISFYPGPSRVYDSLPKYMEEAYRTGVLSMNHRSPECMQLVKETTRELKKKLRIPANYTVLFLSSATECWEVIAQSLVRENSIHLYNGAFGKKWFSYTQALRPQAGGVAFDLNQPLPLNIYRSEMICITQNETSNGTQVTMPFLRHLRDLNPDCLFAVDATSSMGGIRLDFSLADVWFASVQKCFGLPAGLAVMVCSPRAVTRAFELNKHAHYNSLVNQLLFAEKYQTTHTPNVLGIYLLNRTLHNVPAIGITHQRLLAQAKAWYALLQQARKFKPLCTDTALQSHTVIAVTAPASRVKQVKTKAAKAGFLLGEGYGDLKSSTFRIANFPALKPKEIVVLQNFLKKEFQASL